MGTTAKLALRYPAGTDRVSDGALAMQHLAEDVDTPLGLLVNPPRCRAYVSVAQSIPNAANTDVVLGGEEVDTDNMHSTVTNPTRITATTAGWYRVVGQIDYAANATGARFALILKNNVTMALSRQLAISGSDTIVQVTDEVYLAVGDYITLNAYQASTAALNVAVTNTWLHATRVSA